MNKDEKFFPLSLAHAKGALHHDQIKKIHYSFPMFINVNKHAAEYEDT